MTLQATELSNLSLDTGLPTEQFPIARIQGIFSRADLNDASRKKGDNGLEFHEFLEAMVMIAFQRANPAFGQVGQERQAETPLPGCLETLLAKHLLKNAKRDRLQHLKTLVTEDPDVAKAFDRSKPALKKMSSG